MIKDEKDVDVIIPEKMDGMTQTHATLGSSINPPALFAPDPDAAGHYVEFLAANICKPASTHAPRRNSPRGASTTGCANTNRHADTMLNGLHRSPHRSPQAHTV
jgi:hypothetical protein